MTAPSFAAPWGRLAVTVGLLVGVAALPRIGLPGVDTAGFEGPAREARNAHVFALAT